MAEINPNIYIGKITSLYYEQETNQAVRIIDVERCPATPAPGDFTWITRRDVWFIAEYANKLV